MRKTFIFANNTLKDKWYNSWETLVFRLFVKFSLAYFIQFVILDSTLYAFYMSALILEAPLSTRGLSSAEES